MSERRAVVAVIGPNINQCKPEVYRFGMQLGKALADRGCVIVNGGREGLMEAVFRGAKESKKKKGTTIGIIPTGQPSDGNAYCDVVIATGLGLARNQIIVNSADVIIAVAGGAGTLSELAYAWQQRKPVICYTGFEGWAKKLAGKAIDMRRRKSFASAGTLEEVLAFVEEVTGK